jgi:membrane-bound lytic murein transglycosylase A
MAPGGHPLGLIRAFFQPRAGWRGRCGLLLGLMPGVFGIAPMTLVRAETPASLPGWAEDRQAEAIPPLLAGCAALGATPTTAMPPALRPLCTEAATLPPGDNAAARAFFERRFALQPLGEDTLTGYFEPELRGSLRRTPLHATPLHARPPEMVEVDLGAFAPDLAGRRITGLLREGRLVPMPDRSAIQAGALAGRGLELVWVDDPTDAFFLHIQGSGRVRLPDGRVLRIGYAAQNGHPYFAVGRTLLEQGALTREAMSMQAIRDWMRAAGAAPAAGLMARNPSYIFFRIVPDLPPEAGPIGALGVALTPMRSVAVDRAHVPLGLPVWVAGRDPITGQPLRLLTVAQDVGGAIRGRARADLFTGWGAEAAERAGRMRDAAALFMLVPRPDAPAPPPASSP